MACKLFGESQGIQVSEVDDILVESSYRCPSTVHSFSSWPWESSVGYKMLFKNMKVYLSSSLSLPVANHIGRQERTNIGNSGSEGVYLGR